MFIFLNQRIQNRIYDVARLTEVSQVRNMHFTTFKSLFWFLWLELPFQRKKKIFGDHVIVQVLCGAGL